MTINIPEKWRGVLYIVCGIGSIVVTYLAATGVLGAEEVAAWTGFTAFVAVVARFNLGSSPRDDAAAQ